METTETTITSTPDLSWVTAAGGPELSYSGRKVTGLPEEDWWVWPDAGYKDQTLGLELSLHTFWVEPVTGQAGKLLVSLAPTEEGVSWEACFMWDVPGSDRDVKVPIRGRGVSADFGFAHQAAVAWRPVVSVVDGVQLWTNPESGKGKALDLASGELSWQPTKETEGAIAWRFDPVGLEDVMQACSAYGWSQGLSGTAGSLPEMIEQVSEARERIRSAMRNYLLNF